MQHARQQLEVAKAQRPVFTRDNAGNRTYVEDKDRAGVIATADEEWEPNASSLWN